MFEQNEVPEKDERSKAIFDKYQNQFKGPGN